MTEKFVRWIEARKKAAVIYQPDTYKVLATTSLVPIYSPTWPIPTNLQKDVHSNPEILLGMTERAMSGEVAEGVNVGPDGVFKAEAYSIEGLVFCEYAPLAPNEFIREVGPTFPHLTERHLKILYELIPASAAETLIRWQDVADKLDLSVSTIRREVRHLGKLGLVFTAKGKGGVRVKVVDLVAQTWVH